MQNGEIELTFGDGERKYNIAPIGQLLELEEKCGAGVGEIYQRLTDGRFRVNDVFETVRLGLIGAGTSPADALAFARRYVVGKLAAARPVARTIILASLVGIADDNDLGKAPAPGSGTSPGASSDQSSTEKAPPSDLPPARSTA